jgi:hypothetical protein
MIMRPGPAAAAAGQPLFIWFSLLVALMVNMLPLGRTPWMPDLLALTLVFWSVHQPLRVGVGAAFLFGLVMDVHQAAAGPARAGLHRAELLRHHHPPPPAVVHGAVAGRAGAAAVRRRARDRAGIRMIAGGAFPGCLVPARARDRSPALAGGERGVAVNAAAQGARSGRESALVKPCGTDQKRLPAIALSSTEARK